MIYGENRPLERTFYGSVKDLLPTAEELPGWKVEYFPIADTPEMQAKVNETLNYDDAVYAIYTRGMERISVYIAYWQPGKMSPRLVASHTPDVCWVRSGWTHVSGLSSAAGDQQSLAGVRKGGQYRIFRREEGLEYVVFWHWVGREVVSQDWGENGVPRWTAIVRDLMRWPVQQRQEQFLVRISGPQPLEPWLLPVVRLTARGVFRTQDKRDG